MKITEKYCILISGDSEETLEKHFSLDSGTISLQLQNVELPVMLLPRAKILRVFP